MARISAPLIVILISGSASLTATAEVYCESPGEPANCIARPVPEVLRPETGAPDRLITPGANVGRPGVEVAPEVLRPAVEAPRLGGTPGIGAGAPGVGVAPDDAERRSNRGNPVDRPGRR